MNRQEFITELRKSMSGSFAPEEIDNTAVYYEDYIDMQIKKGKTEEEVLRALGDPRLLTKSMKAASGAADGAYADASDDRGERGFWGGAYTGASDGRGGRASRGGAYGMDRDDEQDFEGAYGNRRRSVRLPLWLTLVILLLIVGGIIAVILRLAIAVLPIVLIVAGCMLIYRYFFKK